MQKTPPPLTFEWAKDRLELDIAEANERFQKRLARLADMDKPLPAPLPVPDESDPRYGIILQLRDEGCTFQQISERMKISRGYAAYLFQRAKRRLESANAPLAPIYKLKSVRAYNVLKIELGLFEESITPEIVAERLSVSALLKSPGCGKTTINEIRNWLSDYGLDLSR